MLMFVDLVIPVPRGAGCTKYCRLKALELPWISDMLQFHHALRSTLCLVRSRRQLVSIARIVHDFLRLLVAIALELSRNLTYVH